MEIYGVHQGGLKFHTKELKRGVLNWLHSQM
jgi:hypothetical protein